MNKRNKAATNPATIRTPKETPSKAAATSKASRPIRTRIRLRNRATKSREKAASRAKATPTPRTKRNPRGPAQAKASKENRKDLKARRIQIRRPASPEAIAAGYPKGLAKPVLLTILVPKRPK